MSPGLAQERHVRAAPNRLRRQAVGGSVILLIVSVIALGLSKGFPDQAATAVPADAAESASHAVAVLPFEVDGPGASGWVRLGAMDLVAERLRGAGMAVPPSESVLVALRGAPPAAEKIQLAETLAATTLVRGKATHAARGWTIYLVASDQAGNEYTATTTHADVIRASRLATDSLLASMAHMPQPERDENYGELDERLQQAQAATLAGELTAASAILAALPQEQDARVRLAQARVDAQLGLFDKADIGFSDLIADSRVQNDPILLGRALSFRGANRFRQSKYAQAEQDFSASVNALGATGSAIDRARAFGGRGLAWAALGRFDEAAADLGRGRIEIQRSGDRLGLIQSDLNFGLLELRRNRPGSALPYLLAAAESFDAFGARERAVAALINAFDAQAALLDWPKALALAERLEARRDRVANPQLRTLITVALGTALTALGRLGEARERLDTIERDPSAAASIETARVWGVRAEMEWRSGRMIEAVSAADRALASWPVVHDARDEARPLVIMIRQRALIASGRNGEVEPRDLDVNADDPSIAMRLANAELAAAYGRSGEAERNFRQALTEAEDRGVPASLALVASSYGHWLLAHDRVEDASALAGRVSPWADNDSDTARFQADVHAALGGFIAPVDARQRARSLAAERKVSAAVRSTGSD